MKVSSHLFPSEGRDNLKATISATAKAAEVFDVKSVIVFATNAESVVRLRAAVDNSRDVYAVTFPAGYTASVDDIPTYVGLVDADGRKKLRDFGIHIVQGVMPFASIGDAVSSDIRALKLALDLFGGGLQLCVQAVLMACDSGVVRTGERCIAMSADTAVVAHAENAFRAFSRQSRFAIEHIICKPANYTISRPNVTLAMPEQKRVSAPALKAASDPKSIAQS